MRILIELIATKDQSIDVTSIIKQIIQDINIDYYLIQFKYR